MNRAGAGGTNRNKPVSTVEPFQRQQSHPADLHRQQQQQQQQQHHLQDKINKNGAAGGAGAGGGGPPEPGDPKYQTLPFGTKFGQSAAPSAPASAPASSKSQKIEQLKQEKENNNVQVGPGLGKLKQPNQPTNQQPRFKHSQKKTTVHL